MRRRHLRCHAVAVDIPPGSSVTHEPAPFRRGQGSPDIGNEWPQAIDNTSPIAAARLCLFGARTQPAQQVCGVGPERHLVRNDGPWDDVSVHVREQSTAGERDDGSGMPAFQQRQDGVDHGQTCAEDEHPSVFGNLLARRRIPWVLGSAGLAGRTACFVAGRQHGNLARKPCAIIQYGFHSISGFGDGSAFMPDNAQPARSSFARQERLKQRADVAAVDLARGEAETVGTVQFARGAIRCEPANEMIRIIREGAHIRGAHIEQV